MLCGRERLVIVLAISDVFLFLLHTKREKKEGNNDEKEGLFDMEVAEANIELDEKMNAGLAVCGKGTFDNGS